MAELFFFILGDSFLHVLVFAAQSPGKNTSPPSSSPIPPPSSEGTLGILKQGKELLVTERPVHDEKLITRSSYATANH